MISSDQVPFINLLAKPFLAQGFYSNIGKNSKV
jgi:hypothetical protein